MGHLKNIIDAFRSDGVQAALNYNFITRSSRPRGITISLEEVFRVSPLETLGAGLFFVEFILLSAYSLSFSADAKNALSSHLYVESDQHALESLISLVGATLSGSGYYTMKLYALREAYQRRVSLIRQINGH